MLTPLTDDELGAYAAWARAECDAPLEALVAELVDRRRGDAGRPWAVLIVPPGATAILPPILASTRPPALVVAPIGTRLPQLQIRSRCRLETYDPADPLELRRQLLELGARAAP